MNPYRFLICIFIFFSSPLLASQEANVKGSIAPHGQTFSFFILQYEAYWAELFHKDISLYLDFDTEALFIQPSFRFGDFSVGLRAKAHVLDWQNLEFFTDDQTGSRIRSIELRAAYVMGGAFFTYKFLERYFTSAYVEYQNAFLSDRHGNGLDLANGSWLETGLRVGWYDKYATKPLINVGSAFFIKAAGHFSLKDYLYRTSAGLDVSTPQKDFYEASIHYFRGGRLASHFYSFSSEVSVFDFARSGENTDLLFAYSVGGLETRYRRLAGFAFSEFRVPFFNLSNLDGFFHIFGPAYLWLVADLLILDRNRGGSRIHSGGGIGFYIDLKDLITIFKETAAYARLDYGFTARRARAVQRLQIFLGLGIKW